MLLKRVEVLILAFLIGVINAQLLNQPSSGRQFFPINRRASFSCLVDAGFVVDWRITLVGDVDDSREAANTIDLRDILTPRNFTFAGVGSGNSTASFGLLNAAGEQANNATKISCVAQQGFNRVSGNRVEVIFYGAPPPPTDLNVTEDELGIFNISWSLGFIEGVPVSYTLTVLNLNLTGAQPIIIAELLDQDYVFKTSSSCDAFSFIVIAMNSVGNSTPSQELIFTRDLSRDICAATDTTVVTNMPTTTTIMSTVHRSDEAVTDALRTAMMVFSSSEEDAQFLEQPSSGTLFVPIQNKAALFCSVEQGFLIDWYIQFINGDMTEASNLIGRDILIRRNFTLDGLVTRRSTLSLRETETQTNNGTNITCVAVAVVTSISSFGNTVEVIFYGAPPPPTDLYVTEYEPGIFNISWSLGFIDNAPVSYTLAILNLNTTSAEFFRQILSQHYIFNASELCDVYSFTVEAVTAAGNSPPTRESMFRSDFHTNMCLILDSSTTDRTITTDFTAASITNALEMTLILLSTDENPTDPTDINTRSVGQRAFILNHKFYIIVLGLILLKIYH